MAIEFNSNVDNRDYSLTVPDDDTFRDYADSVPVLTEVGHFPAYFEERGDRLFHSHGSSPYPLPVDTPEQNRLKVEHVILYRLIHANYVGPVAEILAPQHGRQKLALDIGTGSGIWPIQMAGEFPHVRFFGLDIVPIASRYPPPNVQFEVHDASQSFRWNDNTFNLVHARSISMAITDYPNMLQEVIRILRPGGLFVSYEMGSYPVLHPYYNLDARTLLPAATRFFGVVNEALQRRGIGCIAPTVPDLLSSSGSFTDITPQQFYMPIGPWPADPRMKSIGRAFRATLRKYTEAVRPMLIREGWADGELNQIIDDYLHETMVMRGMVGVCYTVHARKREL